MDEDIGKIECQKCQDEEERRKEREDFRGEIENVQGFMSTIIHQVEAQAFASSAECRNALYAIVAALIECRRHCASIGREVFCSAPMPPSKAWRGSK